MELSGSWSRGVSNLAPGMDFLMYPGTDFLLEPIFLRGFSVSLHLLLLVSLLLASLSKKLGVWGSRTSEGISKEQGGRKRKALCYGQTLVCCLGLSVYNLVLCLVSYFYWYKDKWSEVELVAVLDLAARTLSWGALGVYLHTQFFVSKERKFPLWLRIWWGFYLSISCYSLVVDVVIRQRRSFSSVHYLVSDSVSVLSGLFLFGLGFLKCESPESLLDEPLLNGDSSVGSNGESSKSRGSASVTPFANASLFSLLTFSWLGSVIALGNKKALDLEDVPQLHSGDSIVGAFSKVRHKLESSSGFADGISTFKLVKALFFSAWKDILYTGLLALVYTSASYVGPYLIDSLVQCLNGTGMFKDQGYLLASTFLIAKVVQCLSLRHWLFRLQQIGLRYRAALVAMIYEKGLRLSCVSKQGQSSGEMINIMTVDAERIDDFSWYLHDLWLVILQVGLALGILYKNLGLACIAAFVATLVVMLLNFPLGRLQEKFQEKLMESKDKRMKSTSEILRNMRILKLQGWEMKFLSKITEFRKTEEGWLRKYVYNAAVVGFVFYAAPIFVAAVTFGTCVILKIPLESGKILSALATFRELQQPIYNLPDTISMIIQTKVSLDRIASFLRLAELKSDAVERLPGGSSDTAIEIVDGNFSWDPLSEDPTLKDLNLKVRRGMHVAVCGTVGSGKSSLLSCILGEVPRISGTVKVCGTKAYVAQSPWIMSGNIEENVLFGREMDRERYERILEACCLKKDLEILSFGDQTVVGERGINLSGGQKQRMQIARALYQDADIYFFDDPFSAVDAHTGSHLFKEVLLGLLRTKTVVYITHQVEFLPAADLILVMKDGRVTQAGKYDEILSPESDFMELVGAHKEAMSAIDSKQADSSQTHGISKDNAAENGVAHTDGANNLRNGKPEENAAPKGQLIQEEEREKGRVGFQVYWRYIRTAYGGTLVPFILLAQILFQLLQIGSNYWMAWGSPVSADDQPLVSMPMLLAVYVALAIGSSLCILARSTLLVTAGYKTATILFNKMHCCIFRAPMSFFDATPSGRILNRASTDQSEVDTQFAFSVGSLAFSSIELLGIIAVMSQVAWQVFLVFIPLIAISIWYQQYYISSARELSRLVGVCKAPCIQHFAETISGSMTIRCFDQQSRFSETNMKLSDAYSRPKFHNAGAMEWLCFRLDIFSTITFGFSLFYLISFQNGINPAIAGLAVTYGLNLNRLQTWVIRYLCQLENKIISVERILQYMSIPSEPPLSVEEFEANRANSWPSHGEVDIQNLQVRYAPHMPLVLQGLTCSFPGGKKTGIVGRTGSGKSTLIQALFRIVEPTAGRITIDGVDIMLIGLHDLRSRLSIIPQDPTMFEGTIRSNLDPLEEYMDEQIWEALDKCQLGDEVRKREKKLDSEVSENGENWSMGQRQLVCLGRVLLKKSKVLVLDEATASVDTATDNLIQQTLRQHFSDSTVITIAHRITSVLDSDMVLLLSNGLIEEFDSTSRLLENKSSSFSQLVAEYMVRSNTSVEKPENGSDHSASE